jgi:hypothetical protein
MAEPQTVHSFPGLFYHQVQDSTTLAAMDAVRSAYVRLAALVLATCPYTRERSLAMTALEESLMRSIQSLAISDPRTKQVPAGCGDEGD